MKITWKQLEDQSWSGHDEAVKSQADKDSVPLRDIVSGKKIDKMFTVKKHTTPKGQMIYTVYNFHGEKVCKTTSWSRNYVALLLWHENRDAAFHVLNRFGRWDLVGKGDSAHSINDPRAILVKVEGV